MITIFTIPKPFNGHIKVIQRNAIKSWMQLKPQCEIILFGDDKGVSEIAQEFKLLNIPNIDKNEFGTPLLDSVFNLAQQHSSNNILVYVNSDIIIFNDLITTLKKVKFSKYIISGRRYNFDISDEINFDDGSYLDLLKKIKIEGKLHGFSGKDYFIFKKGTVDMQKFAVGRPGWDDWILYHMREKSIPIINSTNSINVIHQNHDYSHSKFGEKIRVGGPEWDRNNATIGSFTNIISLRDADWIIDNDQLVRPPFPLRMYNILSYFYLWRLLLAVKTRLLLFISRIFISTKL